MFARITRYEGSRPEALNEALKEKKNVLPKIEGQTEGMNGAIFLADRSTGTILVISLWESEKELNASEHVASEVREQVTSEGETVSVERYEVDLFAVAQA